MGHRRCESGGAVQACVVIPVYNHGTTVATVANAVRAYQLPVILVDDGSDTDCGQRLQAVAAADDGIELIRLGCNTGKGAAFYAGARRGLARGFSHALQIDADGQHDLAAIPRVLEVADEHPTALITGCPVFDETIPPERLYGRYLTYLFVWLNTWSLSIRDPLCGFRLYPLADTVSLANRYPIAQRMDFDIDVAVRLVWDNVAVQSVRVAVHYPADGISHFELRRDNLLIARLHARLFAGMLVRAPLLAAQRIGQLRRRLAQSSLIDGRP